MFSAIAFLSISKMSARVRSRNCARPLSRGAENSPARALRLAIRGFQRGWHTRYHRQLGHANLLPAERRHAREKPEFIADRPAMPGVWSNAPLAGTQFLDYDGDGLADGVHGSSVYRNTGRGNPGVYASPVSLLKPGQKIDHLSGIGDDWTFQTLYDLDADGLLDLFDADHGGHFWWHRNKGTRESSDFDTAGLRLTLVDGSPVVVGLNRTGFDALQGAPSDLHRWRFR